MVESRVTTAGMLMHKNPLGRDNWARERGPHRSQEQVEILKELATLKAARTTRGRPGRASHQEITRVILCRLVFNDIIIHIKFFNDIILFFKIA